MTSVCFKILEIPERKVGALMGPGGAHIKSLQEVLRVKLGVADDSTKPGSRFVSLWGSPMNVKVAVDVVMLATGLLQPEGGGNGGNNGGGGGRRGPRGADDASSVAGSARSEATTAAGAEE